MLFRRTPRNQHSLKDGLLTITCIESSRRLLQRGAISIGN